MKNTSEKSILIGNGININFGGKAYSNEFIMKRIIFNALENRYDPLFGGKIRGDEIAAIFRDLAKWANEISEGKYDAFILDNEKTTLADFKERYTCKLEHYYEVGLEDWLFILYVFFLKNKDLLNDWPLVKQGFEQMMLDAIYNDGDIQKIYKSMGSSVKKWLLSYDNIFTLNYDNNIEELINNPIFHLHGDYGTLADGENPETVIGYINASKGQSVVVPNFEHCYCNALFGYTGDYKYEIAFAFEKGEVGLRALAKSGIPSEYFPAPIAEMLQVHQEHPELSFCSSYYFDKFRALTGELHIIGMSPNNDNHVFKLINESDLEKIVFYYYSKNEIQNLLPIDHKIEFRSVQDLWKELKVLPKQYNCNYPLPKKEKMKSIFKLCNCLSGDQVSDEEIIKNVNSIPKFKANELCKTVLEKIKKFETPKNEQELEYQFRAISGIALRMGILPSALYIHLIMHRSANKN